MNFTPVVFCGGIGDRNCDRDGSRDDFASELFCVAGVVSGGGSDFGDSVFETKGDVFGISVSGGDGAGVFSGGGGAVERGDEYEGRTGGCSSSCARLVC